MSEKDLDYIRELASKHTIQPRPVAWKKLKGKLKDKKVRRRLITYRNISIAAILISVLSITFVFTMYLKKHNPTVFSSNEQYRPVALEELHDVENEPIYDLEYIDQIHKAYHKIGF